MGRVEARERRAADVRARDHQVGEPVADERRLRRLLRRDDDRPERVLVPSEQLAGEGHRQHREKEQRAREPVRLARELERAKEVDLRHVDEDEHDHGARAEVMDPAYDRTERRVVADELQRVVRAVRRRDIGHREADAGRDLHDEDREGRAAEHVPPAHGALELSRDGVPKDGEHAVLELEPLPEPARDLAWDFPDTAKHAHPCFTVGRGCCRTSSRSPLTCHSRSKSGRGGGPPATVPSA